MPFGHKFSSSTRTKEAGKWKHVYGPTKGMITSVPPTMLQPEASPFIKGMYLKDGEVVSDSGHVDFPTLSSTQTNELNGTVMWIGQFIKESGTVHLVALTTTNAYEYNETTDTWDCITQGTEINDCEAAWDAQSNVTSTADSTIKLRDSKSAKHVIAAGFTTGLISSEDLAATLDLSGAANTYIAFWIRSDTTLASDVLRFRICEDIGGAATNTYNDFTIPALTANIWQHVLVNTKVAGTGTWYSDFDSVDSIALVAQSDPGAITVHIDDVRTVKKFTGDEDNRFHVTVMNDTFVINNGVDQTQKWTGSGTFANLVTTLAAGSITNSELMINAKDHLVAFNNTENGSSTPMRASWTNIGKMEDWIGGTAGYNDIYADESWVMAVLQLSESEWIVYKERSIVKMTWIGGHTPFRFDPMVAGVGVDSKDGVVDVGGIHACFGENFLYFYQGGRDYKMDDNLVRKTIYSRLNKAYKDRLFMEYDKVENELQIWVPTSSAYPDEVWCKDLDNGVWYRRTRTMMCLGKYRESSAWTIADLTGTIGEQNWRFGDAFTKASEYFYLVGDHNGKVYKLDSTTFNNDGTLIENEFQTPDFVLPDTADYMNKFMRVPQLAYEAKGQSVTITYSIDGGDTWNPTQGSGGNVVSLVSTYSRYQQDFDVNCRMIRFKFYNGTVSSGFYLRYFGFYWIPRSGRQ